MTAAVYLIANAVSGRVYVGSSENAEKRLRQHFRQLGRGDHPNAKLQRSWTKHGRDAFAGRLLVVCGREHLLLYEDAAITAFEAVTRGFNICRQGRNALGVKRRPETRRKLRASLTGKRHTDDAKRLMSVAKRGQKLSAEHKQKIAASLRGRTLSAAHVQKIVQRQKGTLHPNLRAAVSESNRRRAKRIKETGEGHMGWYTAPPSP